MGRPTKWKEEYNEGIIEFFKREPYYIDKNGRLKPNDIPFIFEYAEKIGVDQDTLENWAKNKEKYPGFFGAYKKAKQYQERFLIINGLLNLYNPTFAIFTAKNITSMRDNPDLEKKIEEQAGDINALKEEIKALLGDDKLKELLK